MINYIYQLVSPQVFSIKYEDMSPGDKVIVKPEYLSICHADQRYYLGRRDFQVLNKKLPMALIHECCGSVVYCPDDKFKPGDKVTLIPNVPPPKADGILENYAKGSAFLSSGHDGFLREYVELSADRLVAVEGICPRVAAITEFVSVAVHGVRRFRQISREGGKRIGIWGDGSLGFTVANVLKSMLPDCELAVIGRNRNKLSYFSFADETYSADALPKDFEVDFAFECCGGEGSYYAFEDIVRTINPQGTVVMMGVSENKVPINTRDSLEKGLIFIGCSRSGREDFEEAVSLMQSSRFQRRQELIVEEDEPVASIEDLHRVFRNDMGRPFKTVFQWR